MTMASCDINPSVEHPGTATQVIGESGSSNSNSSTTPSRKRGRPRTARLRPDEIERDENRRRASLEARAKNPKRTRKQMTESRLTEGMVFASQNPQASVRTTSKFFQIPRSTLQLNN